MLKNNRDSDYSMQVVFGSSFIKNFQVQIEFQDYSRSGIDPTILKYLLSNNSDESQQPSTL